MVPDGWRSPRALLLGSVWLVLSCAALGLSASHSAAPAPASKPAAAAHASPQAARAEPARGVAAAAAPAAPAAAACSAGMVQVERSCVDRYEAHLLEPQADGT